MKISEIPPNVITTYNNFENRINADYRELGFFISIGSKLGIKQASEHLNRDKAEFGEFLDYEI